MTVTVYLVLGSEGWVWTDLPSFFYLKISAFTMKIEAKTLNQIMWLGFYWHCGMAKYSTLHSQELRLISPCQFFTHIQHSSPGNCLREMSKLHLHPHFSVPEELQWILAGFLGKFVLLFPREKNLTHVPTYFQETKAPWTQSIQILLGSPGNSSRNWTLVCQLLSSLWDSLPSALCSLFKKGAVQPDTSHLNRLTGGGRSQG